MGSKKMLNISIFLAIGGTIIAGLAKTPIMLIIAISFFYISTTVYHPASYSFTSFLFDPKERPKALGIHGAGGTLGMATGPISISIIVGMLGFGWRYVYISWMIPLLLGLLSLHFIKFIPTAIDEDNLSNEKEIQLTKLWTPSLIMFLFYRALRFMATNMTSTFLSLWLVNFRGYSIARASFIFGASSLMGIIAAPIGGLLAARYGEKRWAYSTLLIAYIFFSLAFLIPGGFSFVLLYLGYGFFNFLAMASNSSIMAKLSPSKQRGLGYALYFLPSSLVGSVAPMIAAFIADVFGIYTVFLASIGIFIFSWIILTFRVKVD
jgi:MFS family permease